MYQDNEPSYEFTIYNCSILLESTIHSIFPLDYYVVVKNPKGEVKPQTVTAAGVRA